MVIRYGLKMKITHSQGNLEGIAPHNEYPVSIALLDGPGEKMEYLFNSNEPQWNCQNKNHVLYFKINPPLV